MKLNKAPDPDGAYTELFKYSDVESIKNLDEALKPKHVSSKVPTLPAYTRKEIINTLKTKTVL